MNYKKTILFIFFLVVTVPYATFYTGSINMVTEALPIARGRDDIAYEKRVVYLNKNDIRDYGIIYGPFNNFYLKFSARFALSATKTDQGYIIIMHYLYTILPLLLGLYLFIHKTTKLKLIENEEGKTSFFPFVFAMGIIVAFTYFFIRRVPADSDHLASIFIMMSIFSLAQDNFRLKKHFSWAWVFWGIAFNIHFFAITFAIPMGFYLLLVFIKDNRSFNKIFKKSLQYAVIIGVISFFIYSYTNHWTEDVFRRIATFIKHSQDAVAFSRDHKSRNWFLFLLSNYKLLFLSFFNFALSIICFNSIIKKFKQGVSPKKLLTAIFLSSIFVVLYIGMSLILSTSLWAIIKRMGIILFPLLIISLLGFSSFFKKRYLAVVYLCCFSAVVLLQKPKNIPILWDMFQRHHHGTLSEDYYNRHKASSILVKVSDYLIQQGFKLPYLFQTYRSLLVFPENLHQIYNRKEVIYNRLERCWRNKEVLSSYNLDVPFVLVGIDNKNDRNSSGFNFLSLKNFAQKANCHKKIGLIPNVKRIALKYQLPDPKEWDTIQLENYMSPLKHPYEKELQEVKYVLYIWRKCPVS